MQDHIATPTCFFSSSTSKKQNDDDDTEHKINVRDIDHHNPTAVTRSGQSVVVSTYRTKIADRCRLITVTWCKNLLLHGLSVSVEGHDQSEDNNIGRYTCKVQLKPWHFWRKHGSKRLLLLDGDDNDPKAVTVVWDLRAARFHGETEPGSGYFVAVVCDEEVVLLIGDMKKDGYKKTGCRPALIDPALVSRKEHVFGKRRFSTRAKFHEKGKVHEISIECNNNSNNNNNNNNNNNAIFNRVEPEMEIRLDGQVLVHVKHLQWKFRGNESIHVNKLRVEVFWDVHDWLFSPGLRHALFIFKPVLSSLSSSTTTSSVSMSSSLSSSSSSGSFEGFNAGGSSEFCLFIYAWKVESERSL